MTRIGSKTMFQKKNFPALPIIMLAAVFAGQWEPAQAQQGGKPKDQEKYYHSPSSIHGKTVVIPAGSHIEGRMNETISSKTRQGQRFSIEITSPVLANSTDVLIPSGSKIIGEVVESITSGKQKVAKGMPKAYGKLRTQLNMLTTPDGMTFPIVASIAADYTSSGRGRLTPNGELGQPGMGYVGSAASFEAVHPNQNQHGGGNRGPKVVGRKEFLRDPILGSGQGMNKGQMHGDPVIRSIRKQGREIYIYAGSPLTIRLNAPLKMGIAPSEGSLSIDLDPVTPQMGNPSSNFRRFQPASAGGTVQGGPDEEQQQQQAQPPQAVQQPLQPDPDDDLPAFLRGSKKKKAILPQEGFQPSPNQGQNAGFNPNTGFNQGGPPQGGQPPQGFQQQPQQGNVQPSQVAPGTDF